MAMPPAAIPEGIDPRQLEVLVEQIGVDGAQEVVMEALGAMPTELALLAEQVAAGHSTLYPKTAHRIKGQALMFGLTALVSASDQLERRPQDDPVAALARVRVAWDRAKPWLEARLAR